MGTSAPRQVEDLEARDMTAKTGLYRASWCWGHIRDAFLASLCGRVPSGKPRAPNPHCFQPVIHEEVLDPSAGSELALRNSKGQAPHRQSPKTKTPRAWADGLRLTSHGPDIGCCEDKVLASTAGPAIVQAWR